MYCSVCLCVSATNLYAVVLMFVLDCPSLNDDLELFILLMMMIVILKIQTAYGGNERQDGLPRNLTVTGYKLENNCTEKKKFKE